MTEYPKCFGVGNEEEKSMQRHGVAFVICVLAVGCVSTPSISYYTLDMVPVAEDAPDLNVVVEKMDVSEMLARKDILIRSSATQVEYYATHQWAASVDELVQEKLTAILGPRMPDRKTLVVHGVVQDFGQVDVDGGAEASVRLALEFRDASARQYDAPLMEKVYVARERAASASAPEVVRALSRCVDHIASEIMIDAQTLAGL